MDAVREGEGLCRRGRDEVRRRANQRGVAPHAGVVALAKPYSAGFAMTSFSKANALTRIVWTPVASSAPNSVVLKNDESEVICAPWPDPTPKGVLPMSGTLMTVMNSAPPACSPETTCPSCIAASAMPACTCAGVASPACARPNCVKMSFAPPQTE
jgi:hypothetical protein